MSIRTLWSLSAAAVLALLAGCESDTPVPAAVTEPAQTTATAEATPTTKPVALAPPACALTLGWDPWEPYHYRDVGGEVRGLDIELVAAISRTAGCTIRYDQEDWSTLLTRLRSGQVDMLSGATRTDERERFAWFTAPYRTESFRLYLRAGDAQAYASQTLEDLLAAGKKIGVVLQYVYSDEVEKLADDPRYADQFEGVAVGEVNYEKLLNQEIDAFIEDSFVAASIVRKKGLDKQVVQHPIAVSSGEVHLMLSRDSVDEQTVSRLNEALAQLRESDTYQRILARYLN